VFQPREIIGALFWLALTFGAAFIGSRFLPDAWYAGLKKPPWNPPNWLFAPVWTLLYMMMAGAAWLVWKQHGVQGAALPLTLFILQLALNCAWTWLFFGRHRPGSALVDIGVLWLVLLATVVTFWGLQPLAGQLLIPYLLWVTFATVLNFAVYRLNPAERTGG
jgi:tryptophan-rich sensory protein